MTVTVTVTPIANGVSVVENKTTVSAAGVALANTNATGMGITSVSGLSATNVQDAIEELAGRYVPTRQTPLLAHKYQEGDTWYDTDDNQYKIYRETSTGVFQWVPIMVGSA